MNSQKKMWMLLILVGILIMILSGCSGLPKTAKLNISINPNPVPCSSEDGRWHYVMSINESNGVGVSITSLTFNSYNQEDQLIYTQVIDAAEFLERFEANYIPAFSMLQNRFVSSSSRKYAIVTVEGIDDNDNPIEATVRIDHLPQ
jgi:ABC-type metal ion transport system substrate-binding protein